MTTNAEIAEIAAEMSQACMLRRMRVAARKVTRHYDNAVKPTGIKSSQFTVLIAVSKAGDLTLTDLASRIGMDRTTLTRNLRPLNRDGLVSLSEGSGRRGRSVSLTAKGRNVIKAALPLWREAQATLRAQVGDEVWQSLRSDLDVVGNIT